MQTNSSLELVLLNCVQPYYSTCYYLANQACSNTLYHNTEKHADVSCPCTQLICSQIIPINDVQKQTHNYTLSVPVVLYRRLTATINHYITQTFVLEQIHDSTLQGSCYIDRCTWVRICPGYHGSVHVIIILCWSPKSH